MSLILLLAIPILGGCLAWPAERVGKTWPRTISLATLAITLAIALPLLHPTNAAWLADLTPEERQALALFYESKPAPMQREAARRAEWAFTDAIRAYADVRGRALSVLPRFS